ncbi:MAG TPA: VTT domain-containing protein [Ktedonobacteraceae bacterium]|jgi:membrane-associated protein|nr:VTT domain-containing protein [Ktedonobacteraceae bacterium]
MNTFFLDALQQYGYPVLWLIVFFAAVGLPISGSLLLFASGAFAALGDFDIFILFPVALSAAVMGDTLSYFIGRRVGISLVSWLERRKRFRFVTPESLEKGRVYFRRRAALAIFLSRFLVVALGGPVNLVAGLELYPYPRFLLWDISGQILSVIISLGLGYIFAQSWEEVAGVFGAASSLILALLVVILLSVMLVRKLRQRKYARQAAIDKVAENSQLLLPAPSEANTPHQLVVLAEEKITHQLSATSEENAPQQLPAVAEENMPRHLPESTRENALQQLSQSIEANVLLPLTETIEENVLLPLTETTRKLHSDSSFISD